MPVKDKKEKIKKKELAEALDKLVLRDKAREEKLRWINRINKYTPKKILESLYKDEIGKEELDQLYISNNKEGWQKIYTHFSTDKEVWYNLLKYILSVSNNFIEEKDNVMALITVVSFWRRKIRDIETWVPKSHNRHSQLVSLLNHLFAEFEAPEFLVNGFINGHNFNAAILFLHIGAGKKFKDFESNLQLVLNKKVYHHLFTTPNNFSYSEGFRRAQILSMGGDMRLFKAMMQTQHIRECRNDEFWVTVIDFYIKANQQDMFDYDKIPEMNDYINYRINNQNPTVPYSMKGKTIEMLLRQSEKWHQEFGNGKQKKVTYQKWDGSLVKDYKKTIESAGIAYTYKIVQLKTAADLADEGRKMRHCVGSYASSCAKGHTTIFSLRECSVLSPGDGKSLVTIELNSTNIVQMKAKANEKPGPNSVNLVNEWARIESLNFNSKW